MDIDGKKLFLELNLQLKKINKKLSIICVGGYVLDYYDIKKTQGIDDFFDKAPELRKMIDNIGTRLNMNPKGEAWLNNSVQNLNIKPPTKICTTIFNLSNLKIMIPPLEYIVGMKLKSNRDNDISDVVKIIKFLEVKDIEKFRQDIEKYNFGDIDESLLLEVFGEAYGMNWLQDYLSKSETNTIKTANQTSSDTHYNKTQSKYISIIQTRLNNLLKEKALNYGDIVSAIEVAYQSTILERKFNNIKIGDKFSIKDTVSFINQFGEQIDESAIKKMSAKSYDIDKKHELIDAIIYTSPITVIKENPYKYINNFIEKYLTFSDPNKLLSNNQPVSQIKSTKDYK